MLQHRLLPWCHSHPLTEYNMTPKTLTTLNSHKPLCYSMCCDVISDSFLTGLAAVKKTKRLSCVWMAEKRREGEMGGKLNLVPSCAVFTLALWGRRVKTQRRSKKAEGLVFHSAVSGTSGTVQEVKWGGKSDDALEQTNLNLTSKYFQHQVGNVHYIVSY